MKRTVLLLLCVMWLSVSCDQTAPSQKDAYQPTFESLEKSEPVPEWFKDAKFGIYFHWGVYSVPAYANEWYPRTMYIKGSAENKHHIETYGETDIWPYHYFITGNKDKEGNFKQFAPKLKSEGGQFDPEEWAQLFADAGAKFAGPVAEHHDGFSMWASKVNPWNAKDMGPQLDLVGLFTDAIRKKDMKVILSMHHAYNITGFFEAVPPTDDPKLQMLYAQQGKEKNEALWLAKHIEIIDLYQPDIIWQDFNLHLISEPILLNFLSYYYNRANTLDKEVVATYKDGLNARCGVLDYERGGPADITDNYWLTDDAISSSSWCYTEGIGYYSKKQILHGFLDRISKNGNLLLNISPKADGSIPQEQKDVLLTMGAWLTKYGEAVYATRAWEKYGEGPTKMGSGHGVFTAPAEGTANDIRYTKSKDNTTLYATMLGWDDGQKSITLKSLSADRIDLGNLKSVELLNGAAGNYLPLTFAQDINGLLVSLPEKSFEELAYVIKLNFEGEIPDYDNYVSLYTDPYYHLVRSTKHGKLMLDTGFHLTTNWRSSGSQWKLENLGQGFCKIVSRESGDMALGCDEQGNALLLSASSDSNAQIWKIEDAHSGYYKISNKQFPNKLLAIEEEPNEGGKAVLTDIETSATYKWKLEEVCEIPRKVYKEHSIPGIIEAEDFDLGCPEEVYHDTDEINQGGKYRPDEPVDIDACEGGYTIGWTTQGEWLVYTVQVEKAGEYKISFMVASNTDLAKLHLECDDKDITGSISVPNTIDFHSFKPVAKTVNLEAGEHVLKVVIEAGPINLDKMIFERL